MEANSRPQSVDSVNLGSTYSGFYPTTVPSRSNLAPQQPQLAQQPQQLHHHNNIPQQQPQFQQQYPTHHNNYPISYPNQNQQQQHYPITPQQYPYSSSNNLVPGSTVAQAAAAGASGSQQAQQPPLNHHYNISAYAAAAVAFSNNLKHNQQQQPMVSGSGSAQNRQTFQPIDPAQQQQQLYNNHQIQQWNQQSQHHNPQFVPTTSVGLPPNLSQGPAPVPGSSTNDYYTEYYSQYYREYYRRLLAYHQQQQQQQPVRQKTPLKYGSRLVHARAVFSTHDNRLLVVEPNSRIALYGLQEIFTEQCYPHLFLQSLLLHVPGDLDSSVVGTGNSNGSGTTLLPFNDCQVALDWIRIKLLNDTGINYELKLILKVITMLYRQNGVISGLDLSELLYELVSSSNPEPVNLDINTAASEKMSQISGSESAVVTPFGNKDQLLQHLRQLLMRGQRRVAITYAQNNGLFDHAIALAYLSSYQTGSGGGGSGTPALHSADNGLMISTIRKFISTTLATSDPLYVFYSHLLQLVTNVVSTTTSGVHNNSVSADTTATKSTVQKSNAKIDSLESFIILLANDIEFDKVEITNNSLRHLIDLMIALLKDRFDYVLNDELFHDRFDCLLVNECLEYARFKGGQHNPKLLLRKLEFAFELFDYGFTEHALNYANQIRNKLQEDRKHMTKSGDLFKQLQDSSSLYSNFLLPASCSLEPDSEDLSKSSPNDDFVHDIWLYQLLKLTNRFQQQQKQQQSDLNRPFITELFKLSTKDGADLENAGDNDEEEDQDQEDDEDNEVEDEDGDDEDDVITEADSETINNNNNNNLNDESSDSIQSSLESTPVKQQQRRLPETNAKFEQQLNSNTESNNLSIVKNTFSSSGQQQHPVNSTFSNQQQQQQQFQSNNNLSQQNNESLLSRNELQFQQQNQGMKTMTLRESKIGNSEQFSEQNNSEITDSSNLNFPPPPPPQQQQQQHQPQQTVNSASMMMMMSNGQQQQQQQLAPSTFNNSSSNHIPKYQQQFNNSTRTNLHHHHNLNSISENMENQSQPQQPQQQQSQGDNSLKKQEEQQQDSRSAVFSSAFDYSSSNNVQPQSQQFPNMSNYLPPNVVHTENDNSGFIPNFSNIPNGNVAVGGGDSMLNQVDSSSSLVQQQQPKLFQPPPPPPPPTNMLDSTLDAPPTSTFNFLSPGGHVESIPLYDPISKLMDNKADNQGGQQSSVPSSAADSHRNNQFLQSDNKSNSNNNNDSSSTAKDSTKNSSPSKNNGGLFNVLFSRLRSKNQAILPDDRDPTIVYDEEKKRWIDKSSASGDQNDGQLPPPPKIPIAGPAAATFSNSIPPNFSSTTSSTSEPNSALQSPIMGNLPSLPTFHSLSPAGLTSSIVPGSIPNGGVPVAHSTPPAAASSGLPTRSMSFRKPNRYIDVFNAPNNNSNAAAKKQ